MPGSTGQNTGRAPGLNAESNQQAPPGQRREQRHPEQHDQRRQGDRRGRPRPHVRSAGRRHPHRRDPEHDGRELESRQQRQQRAGVLRRRHRRALLRSRVAHDRHHEQHDPQQQLGRPRRRDLDVHRRCIGLDDEADGERQHRRGKHLRGPGGHRRLRRRDLVRGVRVRDRDDRHHGQYRPDEFGRPA